MCHWPVPSDPPVRRNPVYWLRNFWSPATRQVFQSRGEHSCIWIVGVSDVTEDVEHIWISRGDWRRGRRNEKNLPDYTALTALASSLNTTEYPAGGILSVGDAVNLILAIRVGQLERCSRFALERSTEVRCLKLHLALIGFPRGYTSSGAAFSSRLVRRVSTNFASTKRTWEPRSCFWFPLV